MAALIGALLVPAIAPAKSGVAQLSSKKSKPRTKFVFLKAGSAPTVSSRPANPRRSRLAAAAEGTRRSSIEPPATTLQCGELYFCDVAPAAPAPGSPPFGANA